MEYVIITSLLMVILMLLKNLFERYKLNREMERIASLSNGKENRYFEEVGRRIKIISEITNFLNAAVFLEPFAKLNNELVYKYILAEDRLYEFDDFMTEENQKVGLDDSFLCFKKCAYVRVEEESKVKSFIEDVAQEKIKGSKVQHNLDFYIEKNLDR